MRQINWWRMCAAVALAARMALPAAADAVLERPARASFTSSPEGATVVVNGKARGITPITLPDLAPGSHHVRFTLTDYEPADEFLSLADGSFGVCHADLRPVCGLLLVTSEPTGAMITLDNGIALGETPRLITDLEVKRVHRLLLQKAGYQPRPFKIQFAGRTPLVRHETLILDSGVVDVTSKPAGAEVTVNGLVKGRTPCTVSDIPKGRATFTVSLPGYRTEVRELALNAGDRQALDLTLAGLPGTLRLTAVPDGARFYVNDGAEGKGPVTLSNLAPGTYKVRCELEGFQAVTRDVTVANGAVVNEEFKLENIMGALEVRTSPVGATVLVDGHVVGTTKSAAADADWSDYLIVPGLTEGEHTVVLRKDGFAEVIRHPVVVPKKTKRIGATLKRLFIPNVEIETTTGVVRGVLVENTPSGVTIEVTPGVSRLFPRADIRRVELIDKALQP